MVIKYDLEYFYGGGPPEPQCLRLTSHNASLVTADSDRHIVLLPLCL